MATPRKKTHHEMALQSAIKVQRASTRLKFSLQADYELNERIYEIVDSFNAAESSGQNIKITTDFGGAGVIIHTDEDADKPSMEAPKKKK